MYINLSTEKSARNWAERKIAPEFVEKSVNQMLCFLTECDNKTGTIWLNRGWSKIWERIQENE